MKARISCIAKSGRISSRGSVFLEAAIVLPVLLALTAMALDVGSWLYSRSAIVDATAAAARRSATVVADYLAEFGSGTQPSQFTACDEPGQPAGCRYSCAAAANWAHAISAMVLESRLGTIDGVELSASIRFAAADTQPTVTVRAQRPYRCLICAGFLSGNLTTEVSALVEDNQLQRCGAGEVLSTQPCDPGGDEVCR